jgi:hypothetical protein
MRQLIVATGIAIIAVSSHAQSSTAQSSTTQSSTAAAAETTEPALTKSVVLSAGDSPLVRAAKIAVASRQNPAKRRVITIGTSAGRGRFSQATGPTHGPSVPQSSAAYAASAPTESQIREANQQKAQPAEVQKRLNQLAQEEQRVGAEMDEPYGGDIEEDAVEKRLSDISAERQKLQQPPPPPPQE